MTTIPLPKEYGPTPDTRQCHLDIERKIAVTVNDNLILQPWPRLLAMQAMKHWAAV